MKSKIVLFVGIVLIISFGTATASVHRPMLYHRTRLHHHSHYHPSPRGYTTGSITCSPETKQSTVTAVQQVLSEASQSPDFEGAIQFKEFVAQVEVMKGADEKVHAFFEKIGVDSTDAKAVVEFMGARDHSAYRSIAEQKLSLTPKQAEHLVGKFSELALSVMGQ